MAKPRIFVSSTHYDLKHIRSSLDDFISDLGYEPVLSESGNITYDPNIPLDISCYREASNVDIFVLIIGGRYGSATSDEDATESQEFYNKYESITKKEYESAFKKNIPTYILIEKAVYAEYQTYKMNQGNDSITYAHVDSINIFRFIDEILSKSKNNATHQFEKHSEIQDWLKEQWAGLFRELLHQKTENEQFSSLNEKIEELSSLNSSMKNYLENLMTNSKDAQEVIKEENEKQKEEQIIRELNKLNVFSAFKVAFPMNDQETIDVFKTITSLEDLVKITMNNNNIENYNINDTIKDWKTIHPQIEQEINQIKNILCLENF